MAQHANGFFNGQTLAPSSIADPVLEHEGWVTGIAEDCDVCTAIRPPNERVLVAHQFLHGAQVTSRIVPHIHVKETMADLAHRVVDDLLGWLTQSLDFLPQALGRLGFAGAIAIHDVG